MWRHWDMDREILKALQKIAAELHELNRNIRRLKPAAEPEEDIDRE